MRCYGGLKKTQPVSRKRVSAVGYVTAIFLFKLLSYSTVSWALPCTVHTPQGAIALHQKLSAGRAIPLALTILENLDASAELGTALRQGLAKQTLQLAPLEKPAPGEKARFEIREGKHPTLLFSNSELGSELGLLLAHLAHEGTHALDQEFARPVLTLNEEAIQFLVFSSQLPRVPDRLTPKSQMIFLAERKAYDAQTEILAELSKHTACATAYYEAHAQNSEVTFGTVADEAIVLHHHLQKYE